MRRGSWPVASLPLASLAIQVKASEHVLQCELKLTLSLCVVDEAEGLPDCGVGSHQDGMVQDVDGLGPELQALVLDDSEALGDTEVDRLQTRTGEATDLAVAKAAGGLRDRRWAEPLVAGIPSESRCLLGGFDRWATAVSSGKARGRSGVVVGLAVMGKPSWNCMIELTCQPPAIRSAAAIHVRSEVRPRPNGRS